MPLRHISANPPLPDKILRAFAARERRDVSISPPYSVTQLLTPSPQMAMKMHYDYDITVSSAFSAHRGIMLHRYLLGDAGEDETSIWETRLQYPATGPAIFYGHFDLYEKPPVRKLYDIKYWGTWRVRRVLESGLELYAMEVIWQQNGYRVMLEALGWPVDTMDLIIFCSDTMAKKYLKTDQEYFVFPVPMIDDALVIDKFTRSVEDLSRAVAAIGQFETLPPCEDRWEEDKRCKYYCPVVAACAHGRQYMNRDLLLAE